jgi:hypothetical protein
VHGPIALVEPTYPILVFMPTDQAAAGLGVLAAEPTQGEQRLTDDRRLYARARA